MRKSVVKYVRFLNVVSTTMFQQFSSYFDQMQWDQRIFEVVFVSYAFMIFFMPFSCRKYAQELKIRKCIVKLFEVPIKIQMELHKEYCNEWHT